MKGISIPNMPNDKNEKVGVYKKEFNYIMHQSFPLSNIYMSSGLRKHLQKHNHSNCIEYLESVPDIINYPDYIGINPNEANPSFELIKRYSDNVLVGVKFDIDNNYFYVSTVYNLQESKLQRRLHSSRIKSINTAID